MFEPSEGWLVLDEWRMGKNISSEKDYLHKYPEIERKYVLEVQKKSFVGWKAMSKVWKSCEVGFVV